MTTDTVQENVRPQRQNYKRNVGLSAPFRWLGLGIKDFVRRPLGSLAFGLLAFVSSLALILAMLRYDVIHILFPAIAGFMVMGPALAVGLYEKSRQLERGKKPSIVDMIFVRAESPGQILFVGVMLMLVVMLWLRAAFLLYALFFGLLPFAGFENILETLLSTQRGWLLLAVGSAVGGLFAAFSFAISAYSIPMLLNEKRDAFTAMAISWAIAWNNRSVAIVWGAVVITLFTVSVATAFVGLIVIFPVLGHATWHAYKEMAEPTPGGAINA